MTDHANAAPITASPADAKRPSFADKLGPSKTKKLLALDGGGIRGLITVEVLAGIEATLREALGKPQLVLADYFDYIAGTSTGAIIATCLSLGMSVDRVREFYVDNGEAMFAKSSRYCWQIRR